ncbi:MAG: HD domain-containing protein [Thermoplasmatales archaeon]
MVSRKTIHDSIYGSIDIDGIVSRIVETREFQRLNSIKQLGFTYLVFPGATHSRFEHSLGTYHLSLEASRNLELDERNSNLVSLAGLLHDIGHPPFSHSLEYATLNLYGKDHLDISLDIIEGKTKDNEIADVLGGLRQDLSKVLRGESGILSRLISGNGDLDQIDYLARDSYYTGVALGAVDIPRILKVLCVNGSDLCILEKGLPAIEGLMVARMLMYRTVYRHKTALIAATMASNAVVDINPDYEDFVQWNDSDLICSFKREKPEVYHMLKYRKLPKGIILKMREDDFNDVVSDLGGLLVAHQYFSSPYKKELLKIKTDNGLKLITDFSLVMEFLERELEGLGLIVFRQENEDEVSKRIDKEKIRRLESGS